jgi:hypothetical protein
VVVTVPDGHGLSAGDFVTLYKMKGVPRAGGLYRVVEATTETTFTITFHFPQGYTYGGAGFMLKYAPSWSVINGYAGNPRDTERKTGRPFESTRGRRVSLPK